jgi:hypothetical protein
LSSTIVFELDTPWDAFVLGFEGARALVHLDDGTVLEASIEPSLSTHEGTYPAGLAIRVNLHLSEQPAAKVVRVELTLPSAGAIAVGALSDP